MQHGSNPEPVIRQAVPAEAGLLSGIAHAAKRHWGYPEEWIARWRPGLTVTAADVAASEMFVAVSGERIAGFYALGRRSGGWELQHFWVRPEYMNRGIGRRLFEHAVRHLGQRAPGAALDVEADPHAEGFYLRMGCRRIGEVRTDWQGLTRILPLLRLEP